MWLWLAALVPLAGVAGLMLRTAPSNLPPPPLKFEVLTSYPGNQFQTGFSPDGSHFAFAWNGDDKPDTDLYVQAVGSAEPVRLTSHPHVEFSPAWSPNGRWIAFIRRSPLLKSELFLIRPFGGKEHKLADLGEQLYMDASQLSWSPDGKWLAFPDGASEGYGIYAIAPDSGERRRLTRAAASRNHLDPAFSPDGRRLAFRQGSSEASCEIMILGLSADMRPDGDPRAITKLGRRSFSPAWSADGRHLFFASGIWLSHSNLYRVLAESGVNDPPQALTSANWESCSNVALSWRAGILSYTRQLADVNIWMLRKHGSRWMAPQPVRSLSSTLSEKDPDFSPNGQEVAFVSDRSGTVELWVARLDGIRGRKLTAFGNALLAGPRWSPDGRQILFYAMDQNSRGIWIVDSTGARLHKLLDQAGSASWSADGRFVYYSASEPARPGSQQPAPLWSLRIFKVPANGGESRPVVDAIPSYGPLESSDGRYLFYRDGQGLWRLPLSGGKAEMLVPLRWTSPYAVNSEGIFYLGQQDGRPQRALLFQPFQGGPPTEIARISTFQGFGLAVSRDGNTLLFSQTDQQLTSLMYTRGLW
jgi:Tol biopolymer transport system component